MIIQMDQTTYSEDVTLLQFNDKKIWLIGTAHISPKSANLVKEVIENEKPDTVAIELDDKRYHALTEKKRWESKDIKTIIKEKQLATLIINIVLASYQKKMAEKLKVQPGIELLEAINTAKANNIPIELCDRDVRITLKRAWNSMSFWQKMKFLFSGMDGIIDDGELTEEKIEEIKQKDTLNQLLEELSKSLPVLKRVLIDERDTYLAEKIKNTPGNNIVAVVGAGHVQGIIKQLGNDDPVDLAAIEVIPPTSKWVKFFGWLIPVTIVLSLFVIGYFQGTQAAIDNALFWILASGTPSAIGTILAMGHPLTVLSAFVAAPITTLSPLIGAGNVTALVQIYVKPPLVSDISTVSDDIRNPIMWWKNKLLRVFLVFILSSLGAAAGMYFGAYEIISNLTK